MSVIPGSADYENQQVRTPNRVSGTHRGCRTNLCARVLDTRTWAARASRPPDVVVPASVEAIVRQPPQGNPTASADAETGVEVVAPRTTTVSSGPWGLSRRRPEGGERSRPRRPLG